jgi:uncharacterized protein YndB with AHSA1/START domain
MNEPTEPIHLSFEVDCPAADAFTIWTAYTSRWWPITHSVSTQAGLEVIFEPHIGGRIFERTPGGEEHDWGEITAWEPPHRLAYLWHLRADRADATDVEIIFVAEDPGRTRVEIDHRGWERLGARAAARREGNLAGWDGLLPHFINATRNPEIRRSPG